MNELRNLPFSELITENNFDLTSIIEASQAISEEIHKILLSLNHRVVLRHRDLGNDAKR